MGRIYQANEGGRCPPYEDLILLEFIRYLTNDIPEKADQVEQLLQRAAAGVVGRAAVSVGWALPTASPVL